MFLETVSRQTVTSNNIDKKKQVKGLGFKFHILTFLTSFTKSKKIQMKNKNSSPISP